MFKFNKILGIAFDFFLPRDPKDKQAVNITIEKLSEKLLKGRETENKSIYALFDYRDETIRNMIWSLKYKRNHKVAQTFAVMLYDFLIEEFSDLNTYSDFTKPILIPIPMHKKHRKKRGYNQTEFLAKELYKIDSDLFQLHTDILIKTRNTPHQTKLHRDKRLKNIIGAFDVKNPEKIKGRNVVILDDVTTTGATLAEARKVLRQAGAKKIISVAVGH